MSWRDRPYSGDEFGRPEMRMQFRRPSSVVAWLIGINAGIFVLDVISQNWSRSLLANLFGLSLDGIRSFALWQPVTYMFMHGGVWHILINMIMLYVCGSEFERAFGSKRLLQFYAVCGIVGGLAYLVLGALNDNYAGTPLIGASGAVYGLLVAAIIFFPHIQVVLFIFPVPIRVFGLIMGAILLLQLLSPQGVSNPGGEVCHMAGAATGLALFYAWGMLPGSTGRALGGFFSRFRGGRRTGAGAWARRQKQLADEAEEVDRILLKVHREGLQSLTRSERKILNRATQRQRERDQELDRVHRF